MSLADGSVLEFAKYSGAGNDFIIIDGTKYRLEIPPSELAKRLCARAVSVGADGLIIVRRSTVPEVDLEWEFYNSDGSAAEFCGNGARCAAKFSVGRRLVNGRSLTMRTAAGIIRAVVDESDVKVEFDFQPLEPERMGLDLGEAEVEGFFLTAGVPHFVVFVADIETARVVDLGRKIRFHPAFAPQGTNADFCKVDGGKVFVRTYERGIEGETLACGSGAMAAALVARATRGLPERVEVVPRSGEALVVDMAMLDEGKLILEGPAREVYSGSLEEPWADEV